MTAIVSAWKAARQRLDAAGVDSPAIDARLLLEAALGASRAEILADPRRPLTDPQARAFETLVARRESREPVSRILGRKGFWTLDLAVTPEVLTPRPDTEAVLDAVLPRLGEAPRILDLGVGSGALLLALLSERPNAFGVGLDVSPAAVDVARGNAEALGLGRRAEFVVADWAAAIAPGGFDLVVSNPPYVASAAIGGLAPEVRDHEPRLALDGGADGLSSYRVLAAQMLAALDAGGLFAVEIDPAIRPAVEELFSRAGAVSLATGLDLAGRERVLVGREKGLAKTR